jgi:hypothetical protein
VVVVCVGGGHLKLILAARGPSETGFEPRRGWTGHRLSEIREFRCVQGVAHANPLLSQLYQLFGQVFGLTHIYLA